MVALTSMPDHREDHNSLLSSEELDALTAFGHGGNADQDRDRLFMLKLQLALLLSILSATLMVLFPDRVVYWLQLSVSTYEADNSMTIFRGMVVYCYAAAVMICWTRFHKCELLLGAAAIIATLNFLMDLPYLWLYALTHPSFTLILAVLLRVFVIYLLTSLTLNLPRSTYLPRRIFINPFQYFRH